MKFINTTRRSLLLGIALLGATPFVGFATPASAQTRDDQNTPQSSDARDKHHDTDPANHNAPNPNAHHDPQRPDAQTPDPHPTSQHREGRGPGQSSPSQGRPDFRHTHNGEYEGESYPSHSPHQGQNRPGFQNRSDATKEGDWHHGNGQDDRNRPDQHDFDQHDRDQHKRDRSDDSGNRSNAQLRPEHDRSDRQDQGRKDDQNRPDHRGQGYSGAQGRFEDRGRGQDGRENIGNPDRESRDSGNSYIGTVTKVRSDQSFDVTIGGSTFNVYTNSRTPSDLSKGDTVRVNGVQQGAKDIRDARVSIVRNR